MQIVHIHNQIEFATIIVRNIKQALIFLKRGKISVTRKLVDAAFLSSRVDNNLPVPPAR